MELVPTLMAALTHVHVGAGRGYGEVDLPIVRDSLGIPFIPGSSIKGALKTKLLTEKGCTKDMSENRSCKSTNESCKEVLCLMGPETGDEGASRIVVADFYPLFVPLPSLDKGYVYVTSDLLLNYAESLGLKVVTKSSDEEKIYVGVEQVDVTKLEVNENLRSVHPFLKGANVYKVKDENIQMILERSLIRLTRVRLDPKRKTVEKGALWTEEYLPHGTVLAGAFAYREWDNECCEGVDTKDWKRIIGFDGNNKEVSLVIGGKESVGKGLVKIVPFEG